MTGTVYRSPDKVTCPVCGAPPGEPCTNVIGEPLSRWHPSRQRVPFEEGDL